MAYFIVSILFMCCVVLRLKNKALKTENFSLKQQVETENIILKKEVRELKKQIMHDPLTKAFSRSYILDRVKNLCANINRRPAHTLYPVIAFFDIDDFKTVNDTKGHAAGDATLKIFTAALKKAVRDTDIVARFGGDEFLVTFDNFTDYEDLRTMIKRIHTQIREKGLKSSIGLTVIRAGDTAESAIKRADNAVYKAKEAGKNCAWMLKINGEFLKIN